MDEPPAKKFSPDPTQRRLLHLAGNLRAPSPQKTAPRPAPAPLFPPPPQPLGPVGQRLQQQGRLGPEPGPSRPRPIYCQEDVRSKLFPALAVVEEEADVKIPVAVCERDANMTVAAKAKEEVRIDDFRRRHAHLRFVPMPDELGNSAADPIVKSKISNARLNKEGKARNPYVLLPSFHGRCDYCSSRHCSRFVAGTRNPNCNKYREQVLYAPSRRVCEYRRCSDPASHFTAVCPSLHRRCSRCGCRGHDADTSCDLRNPAVMHRYRADFEEAANYGVYTKYRFEAIEWGFYPIPKLRPPGNFLTYEYLTTLPVIDALATLQATLLLPEHVAMARDHAPEAFPAPRLAPQPPPPTQYAVAGDHFEAAYRRLAGAAGVAPVPPAATIAAAGLHGDGSDVEEYDPTRPYYDS